jgi:cell division protein FtsQ
LALALAVGLIVGAWGAWQARWPHRLVDAVMQEFVTATVNMGFSVQEVFVVGRHRTPRRALLDALAVKEGAPILAVNIHAARERVLALPWVGEASIERLLPDTLVIHVIERKPLALWQHRGKFALIDQSGQVIVREDLEAFGDLLIVVGEDAPDHTTSLVQLLERQPELMEMVEAAVRVGGRRWNLRLRGNIDVRLPEEDALDAWNRLAEYQRDHDLLQQGIQMLDLRLPDRLIVRKTPKREEQQTVGGQDT